MILKNYIELETWGTFFRYFPETGEDLTKHNDTFKFFQRLSNEVFIWRYQGNNYPLWILWNFLYPKAWLGTSRGKPTAKKILEPYDFSLHINLYHGWYSSLMQIPTMPTFFCQESCPFYFFHVNRDFEYFRAHNNIVKKACEIYMQIFGRDCLK